jgi:hypothetical protein
MPYIYNTLIKEKYWHSRNSSFFLSRLVPTPSFDSAILSGEPADFMTRLTSWAGNASNIWSLCWRATKHGWAGSTFHSKCDYKKPTVTIIKVGNFIFGGYANASWEGKTYIVFPSRFQLFWTGTCLSRSLAIERGAVLSAGVFSVSVVKNSLWSGLWTGLWTGYGTGLRIFYSNILSSFQ